MPGSSPPPVAVAVADASLREMVLRLAAVAGVAAAPVSADESGWPMPGAVVVDAAVATSARVGAARAGHRVLMITTTEPGPEVWRAAVRLGAEEVAVLPRDERLVTTWLAATAEPSARGRLVACVSGRGGAGASTLAAALALAGGRLGRALLVDLDPVAGGVDLLLGTENVPGARWPELAEAAGTVSSAALGAALPSVGALQVLSCSPGGRVPSPAAVEAVLVAGARGADLVVADLPVSPTPASDAAASAADTVFVVVPAEVRSVTAAAGVAAALAARCDDVRLVVRHPGPGDLQPRDVADVVGREVADIWPWDRRLGRLVDAGAFARSWRRTSVAGPARRLVTPTAKPLP